MEGVSDILTEQPPIVGGVKCQGQRRYDKARYLKLPWHTNY